MSNKDQSPEIKEYAGGWITEKKHTDVPSFLKYAYIVIFLGPITYCIYYMNGVLDGSERGLLVEKMNSATESSDVLMYIVALLALTCAVTVIRFAFKKLHQD